MLPLPKRTNRPCFNAAYVQPVKIPFRTWEDAGRHPFLASITIGGAAGTTLGAFSYFRFADRNPGAAIGYGIAITIVMGLLIHRHAVEAQLETQYPGPVQRSRPRLTTVLGWYEVMTGLVSVALVVVAVVFGSWSILIPAGIFAALTAFFIWMRYLARHRL